MVSTSVFNSEHVIIAPGSIGGHDYAEVSIGYKNPEKHNFITTSVLIEYSDAVDALGKMGVEYAVVNWVGPTTGYGASIPEFAEMLKDPKKFKEQMTEFLDRGIDVALRVMELPFYTISIMHGNGVYGGSIELTLPYDRIIGSDDLRLAFLEPTRGIIPGFGGMALALARTGRYNAENLVLSAGEIDADTAMRIGMIDDMSPDPLGKAHELVEKGEKLQRTPDGYRLTRRDLRNGKPAPLVVARVPYMMAEIEEAYKADGLEGAMIVNRNACIELALSSDFREGVASFLEKREPQYTGA